MFMLFFSSVAFIIFYCSIHFILFYMYRPHYTTGLTTGLVQQTSASVHNAVHMMYWQLLVLFQTNHTTSKQLQNWLYWVNEISVSVH